MSGLAENVLMRIARMAAYAGSNSSENMAGFGICVRVIGTLINSTSSWQRLLSHVMMVRSFECSVLVNSELTPKPARY